MAKGDDIPKTDPSQIEALIQRLKQSNIEPRDKSKPPPQVRIRNSSRALIPVPELSDRYPQIGSRNGLGTGEWRRPHTLAHG